MSRIEFIGSPGETTAAAFYMGATGSPVIASPAMALAGDGKYRLGGVDMELVDPVRDASWDEEALGHPGCTAFHTSGWARVLSETYGHRAEYCRITRGGTVVALLPLMNLRSKLSAARGISLPFTDLCGPLVFGGDRESAEGVVRAILENAGALAMERGWKYVEFRGDGVAPEGAKRAVSFHGHSVQLEGEAEMLGRMDGAWRRALRKGERSGLTASTERSREAMLEFYGLHAQTRRHHGLPPQPVSFFLNIQKHMMELGNGFVSVVRQSGRAVAASVFLRHGAKAIYKYGASDRKQLEARPNNLAMWHGMKTLAAEGCETLHLGRTSMGNEGLRRFKLGLGAEESVISYYKYEPRDRTWEAGADHAGGAHNRIFSRMPLAINRLLGTLIYPHLD